MAKHIKYYEDIYKAAIGYTNGEFEAPYVIGLEVGGVLYSDDDPIQKLDINLGSGTGDVADWVGIKDFYIENNTDYYFEVKSGKVDGSPVIEPYSVSGSPSDVVNFNITMQPNCTSSSKQGLTFTAEIELYDGVHSYQGTIFKTYTFDQSPMSYAITATYTTTEPNETKTIARYADSFRAYIIDGNPVQTLDSNVYTFSTPGVHTVIYPSDNDSLNAGIQTADAETLSVTSDITTAPNYSMSNMSHLTSVNAPSITYLGNKVFRYDNSLTGVTLGNITNMGDNAFGACTSLTEFHFGDAITSVSYNLFNGDTSLRTLTFDENTTGLTYFQSVGDNTTSLTEVVFPDCIGVYCQASMQYGLFNGSTSLSAVTFGSGATDFQGLVFGGSMPALTSITCKAEIAPSIETGAFAGVTGNTGTLYVPDGSDYSSWLAELGEGWSVSYLKPKTGASIEQTSSSWVNASGEIRINLGEEVDTWTLISDNGERPFYPNYNYEASASGDTSAKVYFNTDANQSTDPVTYGITVNFLKGSIVVDTFQGLVYQEGKTE